jgi:hypothetical protein
MTALTLVMGFYELSTKDNRTIENPIPSRPRGRLIKAHDKHAQCAVVGLRPHHLLRPSGTIHSKKTIACHGFNLSATKRNEYFHPKKETRSNKVLRVFAYVGSEIYLGLFVMIF